MNDETPINEENAAKERKRRLPGPVEALGFAVQERVIWPLQDRFALLGLGPNRTVLLGGGAAAVLAGVAVVFALSSGGGGSSAPATTAAAKDPSPREPLAAVADAGSQSQPKPQQEPPRETLHGAAPVFSPPSPASKGGEKTGESKAAAADAAGGEASDSSASGSGNASAGETGAGTSASESSEAPTSPADATISSDPSKSSKPADGASADTATAARAPVPDGPPAGPAALKVAREFANGFVIYETGGEASAFRGAFQASATPDLTKALLQRPPKQPAGVKVPRAKVLNVVAGPSQGKVYKVSVSLLRVGVTSELRLDMEKTKPAGKTGKRVEWRVTNVLG